MTFHHEPDETAFVAYCLTVPPASPIESIRPLKSVEWVKLAKYLESLNLAFPDLLAGSPADRAGILESSGFDPGRITNLLDRSGSVAIELQRWADYGIWLCSREDERYPGQFIEHLADGAPPLLFGVGDPALFATPGVAIVGSRNVDEAGTEFARETAMALARSGNCIVSGGARGVDRTAMIAAMDIGGTSIGVMSDNLARTLREAEVRTHLEDQRLLLISPYRPDAGFHVGTAMGRNRLIYCLSQAAIVIATEVDGKGKGKGGTWAGAIENLKFGWVPLYVRAGEDAPSANTRLLEHIDPSGRRATPLTGIPEGGELPEPLPPTTQHPTTQQLALA